MRHRKIFRPLTVIQALMLCACAAMLCACGDIVEPGPLTAISIGPPDAALAKGTTSQLVATGIYSDGTRRELVSMVTWSTANAAVASISNAAATAGLLTAVDVGSTILNATYGNVSGTTSLTVTAAALVSVAVTPGNLSLPAGSVAQLVVTGTYTDHSTQNLTASAVWSSANTRVVSVGNAATAGLASLLGVGAASISATVSGMSATTTVSVTAAALASIEVTPTGTTVAAGFTQQFTATGIYTDGSSHDLTTRVAWTSTATGVAAIANASGSAGLATTMAPGSTTVSASLGGLSGSTSLNVSAAVLVSIGLSPPSPSVAVGLKLQLAATGVYSDHSSHGITTTAVWTSSAPTVAAVSNATGFDGLASAISPGSTLVTATIGSISGELTLNVTAEPLASLTITPAAASIAAGTAQQFAATGTLTDNSVQVLTTAVTWSSSAESVVAISNAVGSNGLATSSGEGSSTITATLGGVSASAILNVTAATLVAIGVTPAAQTVAIGTDQQFTATGTYTDNSVENLTTAVTWNSSAPAIAAISNASGSNGLATAQSAGGTTVSASFAGITGSTAFTVSATRLVAIAVTPVNPRIGVSTQQQFTATGTFSDHSTQDLTSAVTWTCADTRVAVLLNESGFNGLAVAQGTGSTTVTASLNIVSGSTGLTVLPATLQSIVVTPANPRIADGTQQQFTATGHYSDHSTQTITSSVTWASSAPTIAPIGNAAGSVGIASALKVGSTTIKATLQGITGSTTLSVTSAALASIAVTPPNPTLATGYKQWFVATGTYTDGSTKNLTSSVTWSSSAQHIASISSAAGSAGLATADPMVGSTRIGAGLGSIHSPPVTLTVIAAQEYAYVANDGDVNGTVSQYTIGSGSVLTATNPPTVSAGVGPAAIALDPKYRYAYVVNNDGTVSEYTIGSTGALTPMSLATVAAGQIPQSIAVDPTGRFVYVANSGDGTVSQFTIGLGGALAPMHPAAVTAGGAPEAVAIDPSGRYLYVADGIESVAQFTIGSDGALTAMNPASVAAGSLPQALAVAPSRRYVYVANGGDNTLSQFSLGAGGALTALNPSTVATGTYPTSVTVDPSDRYVYVAANSDGTLWQYGIGTDGSLSVINAGNTQAGGGPQSVIVDLSDSYVYVSVSADAIGGFVIGAGGTLPNASSTSTPSNGAGALAAGY